MIVGPTKCAKSAWARTLGDHIYFRNCYDLGEYRLDADYVVFDDIRMEHVHAIKCWIGSMGQFTDTDKFRKKQRIRWGPKKCCIVLCNEDLGSDWRYSPEWKANQNWFDENVLCVEINSPLY